MQGWSTDISHHNATANVSSTILEHFFFFVTFQRIQFLGGSTSS